MPALRDSVFAQEAVTTDGGLTIPICDYAEGDLLFAFCIGDAAVTTWTCSNGIGSWTQLFAQSNTGALACYWKYAAASGEGDVVFTASTNDTYSGFVCSVRDCYQGYTSGSPPVKNNTTQASSTRFAMPTLTTSDVNSLILMVVGNTAANGSNIFAEGKGITQTIINGAAEGGALGWFVQPSAALTPSDIFCGATTGGNGIRAVIEVRQPAGGTTAIPAYSAADDSQLLVINPGLAYDGSTALAATADTNFGTSIGGKTANDATVATSTVDMGVDPKGFINAAGHTNAASATAVSGSNFIVPAGKYNIGDANILGHLRSVTTIASQNLGAMTTTHGVWFGMRSGATAGTNYKIWQVHGGDAPYYGVSVVPFVISNDNADTRATAGTLSNSDVRYYGYWTSGVGVLTGQTILGPVWKMGTTTVAGGTSVEPVGITGLEYVLTKGKIRWSAIRQGANQMLCLQAVQFGNGGTNPIYLDLNATAIEFPSKRNVNAKLINYNGADNSIGLTYYAGAADTIKHRASVVSSPSPYHWRIHASSSASATYDFSGLSVIGAGDVQLRAVTTFSGITFTDCLTITQNSAVIDGCTFTDSKITSAALADMDNISNCSFTSSGTGHAIEVGGSASTITFTGNTFTGYAASNGSTGNEAIYVNITTGTVTINISGGDTPSIRTAGATVIVNNSKTKTFTGLPENTEVRIRQGSYTLAQQQDVTGGSYAYSYTPDSKPAKAQFTLPGYVFEDINITLDSSDQSFPVTWAPDPSYTA